MKTLELKHVAPYLAHKAHVQWVREDDKEIIVSFLSISDYNFLIKRNKGKLILRPLSQLTQDEKTCDEINLLLEPNGLEINNFLLLKNTYEAVCISWQEMQEVLNVLYREHYDVFGLIEQGLAIEKKL